MASIITLKKYIERCDQVITKASASDAKDLVEEILSVFQTEYAGLKNGLKTYTSPFGDCCADYIYSLRTLKNRLELEMEKSNMKENNDAIDIGKKNELQVCEKCEDKPHKVFISHSSHDADYVGEFVGLLETLGLREDEIICSSVPPYCIPLGNKVYEWLVNEFQQSDLHVIYMLSNEYYTSAASLNEMGAAWALKQRWTAVLLPGFPFSDVKGCIDSTQIGIKLDDEDKRTLNYRLGELKDKLTEEFGLRKMAPAIWERKRDEFLERIKTISGQRKSVSDRQEELRPVEPVVGHDDVGIIPVDPAFLLVYAAVGDGRIIKCQNLGTPVTISTSGKEFMAEPTQRESARWQEALDMLISWGWVKPVSRRGDVFELTGTGYKKADWLKDGMQINTENEPLDELEHYPNY